MGVFRREKPRCPRCRSRNLVDTLNMLGRLVSWSYAKDESEVEFKCTRCGYRWNDEEKRTAIFRKQV